MTIKVHILTALNNRLCLTIKHYI